VQSISAVAIRQRRRPYAAIRRTHQPSPRGPIANPERDDSLNQAAHRACRQIRGSSRGTRTPTRRSGSAQGFAAHPCRRPRSALGLTVGDDGMAARAAGDTSGELCRHGRQIAAGRSGSRSTAHWPRAESGNMSPRLCSRPPERRRCSPGASGRVGADAEHRVVRGDPRELSQAGPCGRPECAAGRRARSAGSGAGSGRVRRARLPPGTRSRGHGAARPGRPRP
jgi:hypothetical protein